MMVEIDLCGIRPEDGEYKKLLSLKLSQNQLLKQPSLYPELLGSESHLYCQVVITGIIESGYVTTLIKVQPSNLDLT